jgi:hypothetical protein
MNPGTLSMIGAEAADRVAAHLAERAKTAARIAELEAALRNLVADVDDYERVNNLAPNPGRLHCWESMRVAKDVLSQSTPEVSKE